MKTCKHCRKQTPGTYVCWLCGGIIIEKQITEIIYYDEPPVDPDIVRPTLSFKAKKRLGLVIEDN